MSNLKVARLIKVDVNGDDEIANGQAKQNNKYYYMTQLDANQFEVKYGRIDVTEKVQMYPMSKWDSVYKEKTTKSKYQDVTHLYSDQNQTSSSLIDISNTVVKTLMDNLQRYANASINQNYTISSSKVTPTMVKTAQQLIDDAAELRKQPTVNRDQFNKLLLDLYRTIPRKMKDVRHHLITESTDILLTDTEIINAGKLLDDEQATLDVMTAQVNIAQSQASQPQQQVDILQLLGLEISEASQSDIENIKQLLGPNKNQFKRAYAVTNNNTQKQFSNHISTVSNSSSQLYWHGSRNQNWLNILSTGLMIRPAGAVHTGSMFGDGIYFADKAQKSIGYTSLRGSYWAHGGDNTAYLALFSVHVGNQKHIHRHDSSCYRLSKDVLFKEQYDSVFAHGGADLRNNEYIVYQSQQCTISFLVEIGD